MNLSFKSLLFCLLVCSATSSMLAFNIVVQNNDTGELKLNIKATCSYGNEKVSKIIQPGEEALFPYASKSSLPTNLEISYAHTPTLAKHGVKKVYPNQPSLSQEELIGEWEKASVSPDGVLGIGVTNTFEFGFSWNVFIDFNLTFRKL